MVLLRMVNFVNDVETISPVSHQHFLLRRWGFYKSSTSTRTPGDWITSTIKNVSSVSYSVSELIRCILSTENSHSLLTVSALHYPYLFVMSFHHNIALLFRVTLREINRTQSDNRSGTYSAANLTNRQFEQCNSWVFTYSTVTNNSSKI